MSERAPGQIVLATNNAGKLRELQALLAPLGWQVLPKSQFTHDDVAETGSTFVANALIKARHAAAASGLPALADDSGIEVDALGGAPGIYSARYAGANATDQQNLDKLLQQMSDVPDGQRQARYRCALVWVNSADDPQPVICEASWEGEITRASQGHGGFGYDPIFWLPDLQCTAAEVSADHKNQLSHRGKALRLLVARLSHHASAAVSDVST